MYQQVLDCKEATSVLIEVILLLMNRSSLGLLIIVCPLHCIGFVLTIELFEVPHLAVSSIVPLFQQADSLVECFRV